MKITLTTFEIQGAIIEYVRNQISVAEGKHLEVDFDGKVPDISAIVSIVADEENTGGGNQEQKPKPQIGRKPAPGKTRVRSSEAEQKAEGAGETALGASGGETKPKSEEPPFDVDPKPEAEAKTDQQGTEAEDADAPKPTTPTTVNKLFANPVSSAAPETPKPAVVDAKSLFANLKPVTNGNGSAH